jgi:hypothetical protein
MASITDPATGQSFNVGNAVFGLLDSMTRQLLRQIQQTPRIAVIATRQRGSPPTFTWREADLQNSFTRQWAMLEGELTVQLEHEPEYRVSVSQRGNVMTALRNQVSKAIFEKSGLYDWIENVGMWAWHYHEPERRNYGAIKTNNRAARFLVLSPEFN